MMSLAPKDPDVAATYSIDFHDAVVREAKRDYEFTATQFVRPQRGTGFYYECTTAGRTSAHYPVWSRAVGETVTDGSVVWTARHPTGASVPTISSAAWTVPSGLTLDSQSEVGLVAFVTLSDGVDGVDYEVTCLMTPSSGNPIEQTITIPVRAQ
jgi:hypothetical protein